MDNIKNEEVVADNGSGSPGSDPSNEGPHGSTGHLNDRPEKTAKSDATESKSRSRHLSNATGPNTGTGSAHMPIDAPAIVLPDENISSVPVAITSGRKPHKRKLKQDTDDIADECPPKVMSLSSQDLSAAVQSQRLHLVDGHAETSVKDLENAMSKHLPSPVVHNNNNNTTTDFSTDALLKQQQEKSSTIQWIGAHHHNPFHQQSPPMPATALLRQLYANRESVIRATARQSSNGVFYPGKCRLMDAWQ